MRATVGRLGCSVVLFASLLVSSAEALCIPKDLSSTSNVAEPFAYLDAVIDSLVWAKQGRSRVKESPANDLAALMQNTKAAQADYMCAAKAVGGFRQSSDEVIQTTALVLAQNYEGLAHVSRRVVTDIVGLLDQASRGQTPGMGTVLDRLTDIGAQMDEMWKILPMSVIAATYVLPQYGAAGQPTGRFRITRAERQRLLQTLEKQFGLSVRVGMQAGQHALDGAAGVLYQFLADRKWRSVDDP